VQWAAAPRALRIRPNDVHVWRATLDVPASTVAALARTLGPDERDQASAFHRQRDRSRFVAAHGILRAILARYLGIAPRDIAFARGPGGKPCLADEIDARSLRFNLAHSEGLALCAVAYGRDVGVDVERIAPELADLRIAEAYFAPEELETLRATAPEARPRQFFTLWTRKEAALKATGEGIPLGLAQGSHPECSVKSLSAADDYVGAVATFGEGWSLAPFAWR
jgi:4'-phosphopantetheinyl transferase